MAALMKGANIRYLANLCLSKRILAGWVSDIIDVMDGRALDPSACDPISRLGEVGVVITKREEQPEHLALLRIREDGRVQDRLIPDADGSSRAQPVPPVAIRSPSSSDQAVINNGAG